jgi:hypothetical protein
MMRWIKSRRPFLNDTRVIRRFLIFPRTINYQTRWLEFVRIRQYYGYATNSWRCWGWHDSEFVDT